MEVEDYKGNSHKEREKKALENATEHPRAKSVVTGATVVKKRGLGDKIRDTFIAEDLGRVRDYIIGDVVIPDIKKAVDNIVSNGVHMLLYGAGSSRSSSSTRKISSPSAPRVSYRDYYSQDRNPVSVGVRTNAYNFDDVVFDTRGDAELVLEQLVDILQTYGTVSVQDYYDSCGETSPYTTCDYGWRSLKTASIARVAEGYIIRMPKAVDIRR